MEKEKKDDNGANETIDLAAYTESGKKPPVGKKYGVIVDEQKYIFDHHIVTGKEVLEKAGKLPVECHSLYLKLKHCDFKLIGLTDKVDLTEKGVEHFVTKPPVVFHYFVDNERESTEEKELTPNQILELAGITPVSDYYLVQILPDGKQISYKDSPTTPIKMKCPAMKFVSVFRGETPVS